MRIEQLHVDGFGKFNNRDLNPNEGLTLVRGLNEAGKSTLLGFVRAILFGFDGNYPALAGGKRGGRIRVRMADGRSYLIERFGDKRGGGSLKVFDDAGAECSGELPRLLQNVDATLFGNVFAFGLGELASFDKLKGDDVASRIYGAGLGIGDVNPVEVEKRFASAAGALFLPSASKPVINDLLGRLEDVDKALKARNLPADFEARSTELRTAEAARELLSTEVARLEAEVTRSGRHASCWSAWQGLLDAQARRAAMGEVALLPPDVATQLGTAIVARDDAQRHAAEQETARQAAADALAAITVDEAVLERAPDLRLLGDAAIKDGTRMEQLAAAQRDADTAQAQVTAALARLGAGWDADRVTRFDDSLAVETELNGRLRTLLTTAQGDLAGARTARAQAERGVHTVEADLVKARQEHDALVEPEGAPTADVLERQVRDVDAAVTAVTLAQSAASRARAGADEAGRAVGSAPGGRTWDEAAADLADLTQAIRDEAAARASVGLLEPVVAGTAGVPGATPAKAALPAWAIALIGVAVGVVLFLINQPLAAAIAVVAGLVLAFTSGRSAGAAPVAGAAVGAAAAYAAARQSMEEAAARRATPAARLGLPADAGQAAVEMLAAQVAKGRGDAAEADRRRAAAELADRDLATATAALAAVAREAGLPEEPAPADVDALRARSREARTRANRRDVFAGRITDLEGSLETRAALLGEADTALESAWAADAAATTEWQEWLVRHDLVGAPDRETAQRMITQVTAAKSQLGTLVAARTTIESLREEHAAHAAAATALAVAVGRRPADAGVADGQDLARMVETLAQALSETTAASASRTHAREVLATADRTLATAQREFEEASASLEALFEEHGVTDESALRAALARSAEAKALDDTIASTNQVLTAQSGAGEALDALKRELAEIGSVAEVDERLAALKTERDDARRRLDELSETIGGLRKSVAEMLQDASDSVERQRREDLLGALDERSRDWAANAVARHLLHTARQGYESAHRPAVLGIAERYFSAWTQGRFTKIIAPLGSVIERVERDNGEQVALDALSLGTAQQLYLAVRFGLLEHFAQNAEPLPVVMDDILVNFDPERAALTAASIRDLAKRHQVIYFTCHKEVPLVPDEELTLQRL